MNNVNASATNPFLVENEAMLRKVGSGIDGWSLSAHYQLTANINLNNKEWVPIGIYDENDKSKAFTGTFDGNGKTISGFYINNPKSDAIRQGLFGYIGQDGTVENITVIGRVIGNTRVGGIVGTNNGEVENCSFNGYITGNDEMVGGIAGRNNGKILSCTSTGSVEGNGNLVGGVVGSNTGTIENCYSTVYVKGYKDAVGGVVGSNTGTVAYCYSIGNTTGDHIVGGVVGANFDEGIVKNSYSTGDVICTGEVGGVVGNNANLVDNCYSTSKVICNDSIVDDSVGIVGGVVGLNLAKGAVKNSYFAGSITGAKENVGGVVGINDSGTVCNCVALNISITRKNSTYTTFGRIVGSNCGSLANNYGLSGMTFIDGTISQKNFPKEQASLAKPDNGIDVTETTNEIWWKNDGPKLDFVNVWQWDNTTNLPTLKKKTET